MRAPGDRDTSSRATARQGAAPGSTPGCRIAMARDTDHLISSFGAAAAVPTLAAPARTPVPARAGRWAATVLLALALGLAALMLVPGLIGYQRYVITGGSMTGSIDRGSVVFDREVPVEQCTSAT